jgi:hypothetical protein
MKHPERPAATRARRRLPRLALAPVATEMRRAPWDTPNPPPACCLQIPRAVRAVAVRLPGRPYRRHRPHLGQAGRPRLRHGFRAGDVRHPRPGPHVGRVLRGAGARRRHRHPPPPPVLPGLQAHRKRGGGRGGAALGPGCLATQPPCCSGCRGAAAAAAGRAGEGRGGVGGGASWLCGALGSTSVRLAVPAEPAAGGSGTASSACSTNGAASCTEEAEGVDVAAERARVEALWLEWWAGSKQRSCCCLRTLHMCRCAYMFCEGNQT